jgi:Fe-S cluster assembly ATP-binding protein
MDLLQMSVEQRMLEGLFVSFQYPIEISGISNFEFLQAAYNAQRKAREEKILNKKEFEKVLFCKLNLLDMNKSFVERNINESFSGGEKKKNEILQMALFSPTLSILDEIDSGLDIDALKLITQRIKGLKTENQSLVLITHYQRLLNYIVPDYVHVLSKGRLIKTGGRDLAIDIEKNGYDWIEDENAR